MLGAAAGHSEHFTRLPGELKLWDLTTGKEKSPLHGHAGWVHTVAFTSDGQTLVSGGGEDSLTGEIKLWHAPTGQLRANLPHRAPVRWVALSADDRLLAASGHGAEVKLWNLGQATPASAQSKGSDR
jgi:WD40 repeat protein